MGSRDKKGERKRARVAQWVESRDAEAMDSVPLSLLPFPRFRFRFLENVVISFVAQPYVEAAPSADRSRFRIRGRKSMKSMHLIHTHTVLSHEHRDE